VKEVDRAALGTRESSGGSAEEETDRFELVTLRNGSRAVRHLGHGEIMHPSVGPWAEAKALYVDQVGLRERLQEAAETPLRIYDVGLGAAANAAAALTCAIELGTQRQRELHIVSFERTLEPLRLAAADPSGFPFLVPLKDAVTTLLAEGEWRGQGLRWSLLIEDASAAYARAPRPADLVFFDPFSPDVNPELWTRGALRPVYEAMAPERSLLVTYSASTRTRVSLLLAGFHVGIGAPIGTKSETTVAGRRAQDLATPLGARWLQRWERSSSRAPHGEELTPALEAQLRGHPQFQAPAP
jgi:tRNA U34 5-methylaminomethyl-2-thiouridine-forming methyltransferase MnmC